MAYNTGNPIGSTDPRDLSDNAENADRFVNGSEPSYQDRLGANRKSYAGMESEFNSDQSARETVFNNFISSSGYEFLGDYAGGIEVTAYNQVIRESGEFWKAAAGTSLPYTTTGAGMPEGGVFVSVGDANLRQEIGSGTRRVDNLNALQSLSGRFSGDVAYMVGRTTAGDGGEGIFRWDGADLSGTLVTATITSTSVDSGTDTITSAGHGLSDGDGVTPDSTVNGLTANDLYWVVNATTDTFQLSTNYGGSAVDLTGTTNFTVSKLLDPLQGVYVVDDRTGAGGAWARQLSGSAESIYSGWFGFSDFSTDAENAQYLTVARRYAQLGYYHVVQLPPGLFNIARFALFDSAGSERQISGDLKIRGAGSLKQSDTFGSTNGIAGTILNLTETTLDGVVAADGEGSQRRIIFEDLSMIYGGSSYAVGMKYCPFHEFRNVSIQVTSSGGGLVDIHDSWLSVYEKFIGYCKDGVTSTAKGLSYTSSIFAGNLKIKDSIIDNFDSCFYVADGNNFTNIILENTALQKFKSYGLLCEGAVWNLILNEHYTETDSGISAIKISPVTGNVTGFSVNGLYALGGSSSASFLSGPAIDVSSVLIYQIKDFKYYRPYTAFIQHGSGVGSGSLENFDIQHDNPAAIPALFYAISGAGGRDGNVQVSDYSIRASTKIELFDPSSSKVAKHDGTGTVVNALSHGSIVKASTSADVYDLNAADPRAVFLFITAGGVGDGAVRLPAFSTIEDSDIRYVLNDPGSANSLIIRDSANNNVGVTIAPGVQATCIADKSASKWIVTTTTATYGP